MRSTWRRKAAGLGLVFSALALVPIPAHAVLSPLYESMREIETILQDPRLAEAFANQQAVISITSPAIDTYELRTQSCTVTVKVVDVPAEAGKPMIIGPRRFALEFGQAECTK